jgi:hypothetical protein
VNSIHIYAVLIIQKSPLVEHLFVVAACSKSQTFLLSHVLKNRLMSFGNHCFTGGEFMNIAHSNAIVTNGSHAKPYYQVGLYERNWAIMRSTNGHVFCICRNRAEAFSIANSLNQSCQLNEQNDHAPSDGS